MTNNKKLGCVLALMVAVPPASALAQGRGLQFGTGAVIEGFGFLEPTAVGMNGISLLTVPFALRYTGPVVIELSSAYALGVLIDTDGDQTSIAGPTDTSVRLSLPLADDRITLSGAAFLPTGKATQTPEEATVAGVIAADLLPFRITNWGTGGGFDVSASVVIPMGGFGVGARVGYSAAREFEPLEGGPQVFSYQPGDQMYVRVALDRAVGATGKATVSATMQRFNDDAFDGVNIYRSGDRLEVLGSLNMAAGTSGSAALYGGVMHRSKSAFIDGSQELSAQDLIVAGAGFRIPGARVAFLPSTDLRVFRSGDGLGQGYALGLGAALEIGAGNSIVLPSVRARLGKVVVNDRTSSAFVGAEIGLTMRFGGRR
jgi:hypothetical protein